LDSKSIRCIFLEYSSELKAYHLGVLETKIIINRDVLFNEVLDAKSTTEVFPDEEISANKHKLGNEVGVLKS
jgi:hypothetical protein